MALFNWFKRKNAQAVEDKDKGGMKFNAADVFVDVNGKKISVGELEKYMIAEEAEQEKMKELEMKNELEPMSMDDKFVAANGKEYKIGEMVNCYTKAMEKKNGAVKKNESGDESIKRMIKSGKSREEILAWGTGPDGWSKQELTAIMDEYAAMSPTWGKKNSDDKSKDEAAKAAELAKKTDDHGKDAKDKEAADIENAEKTPADEGKEAAFKDKKAREEKDKENDVKDLKLVEERENTLEADEAAKTEEEAKKKENAKKEGEKYFKEIQNAKPSPEDDDAAPTVGKSRTERAADWAKRNSKKG